MGAPEVTLALHAALGNVARELDILARKAHQIDEAMGDAICAGDTLDTVPLALTQDVDLLRQSADCLHILLKNLAEMTTGTEDGRYLVDANAITKGVYMTAIRTRVAEQTESGTSMPAAEGEWLDL